MTIQSEVQLQLALDLLNSGLFVVCAQFESRRGGLMARSVQAIANSPPMVAVAIPTGQMVSPLIRDSRHFSVCSLRRDDLLARKKFAQSLRQRDGDPFDSMQVERLVSGAPVLSRSELVLDCEVFRHMDLEADHELFIGKVIGAVDRTGPGGRRGNAATRDE